MIREPQNRDWTAYNAAQSEEKTRFVALLADLCNTVAQPKQEGRGRPRLPLSDMVCASVYRSTWALAAGGLRATFGTPSLTGT